MTQQEAIQRGLQSAKEALAQEAEKSTAKKLKYKGKLAEAYNLAGGLLEGLTLLQDMPTSTFQFRIEEETDKVHIRTNIPLDRAPGESRQLEITIDAHGNGHITTFGDNLPDHTEACTDVGGRYERVLEFVAKKAAVRGLIKP